MTAATATQRTTTKRRKAQWLAPTGLVFLSLIPVIQGVFRLSELTGGTEVTLQNARFFESPIPVVTHIVSGTVFALLGAFQFVPSLRGRRTWHRIAGRILIPAGLLAALSGLWMALFYTLPDSDGELLLVFRLVFGLLMVASILTGIRAIHRRDFVSHSRWLTRAYAIGVAAGTQALVLALWIIFVAPTNQTSRALLLGLAWATNLAMAEYVIHRRTVRSARRALREGETMRATIYRRFGGPDVVELAHLAKPEPGRTDVLVRVHASTVSTADHRARSRNVPKGLGVLVALTLGVFRPRRQTLGMDAAGVIEAVGADVTSFTPGDEVIAMLGAKFGGHAEYVLVHEHGSITAKPRNMSFEEAVTLVFGGITARGFMSQVSLKPGDRVLVNGASGAVGTAVVQLAKHLGAHVTGVSSRANAHLVTSLGVDRVIDYTTADFTAEGTTYHLIVDCVGNADFDRVQSTIKPGGALLLVIGDLPAILLARSRSRRSGKAVVTSGGPYRAEDLAFLVKLAEARGYRPVIDRIYNLPDIAEAHRYVDTGRKKGNVVIRIPALRQHLTEGSSE